MLKVVILGTVYRSRCCRLLYVGTVYRNCCCRILSKIYDKRDDFDFAILNFPFLDGDVPRTFLMVFTSLNLFAMLRCLVI